MLHASTWSGEAEIIPRCIIGPVVEGVVVAAAMLCYMAKLAKLIHTRTGLAWLLTSMPRVSLTRAGCLLFLVFFFFFSCSTT